jgi:chloramphenicol-sensitive protein RarD
VNQDQTRLGYLYGFGAYALWGFFPAYFKLLRPSTALEILAHRIAWSTLAMIVLIAVLRHWRRIATLRHEPKRLAGVALAAVLIAINWGTYIYAVNINRVVETSLGYFITPLVVILLGVFVLRERLRGLQWAAVGVGTVAVLVLTIDYGHPPWYALVLAASFGLYGLVKKKLGLPAVDGFFVESAVLTIPALAMLIWLGNTGQSTYTSLSAGHTLLLTSAGVVTAVPLLMFAGAANRIPLSDLGVLQYIAPILQLALGVFMFHEPMPAAQLVGFGIVWLALAIFTWDSIRQSHRTRAKIAAAAEPAIRPV